MKPTTMRTNWIRRLTAIAAAVSVCWAPMVLAGQPEGCVPGWVEGVFPVNTEFTGLAGSVFDFIEFDDGNGTRVYAGGDFSSAAPQAEPLNGVAYWDGEHWQPLLDDDGSSGVDGTVRAMAVYDDGTGAALYVAGEFSAAGGHPAANIAKWDGNTWSPLDQGVDGLVRTLEVHHFGVGLTELVVGGDFGSASGAQITAHIARWNGQSWAAMARDFPPYGDLSGPVYSLKSFDDGSGLKLYATGAFTQYAPEFLAGVARWDGTVWRRVGGGLGTGDENFIAHTLHVHDDGSGPALFAGGNFQSSRSIYRWNGSQWELIDSELQGGNKTVFALGSLTVGSDRLLVAGGSFDEIGGLEVSGIAAWNGTVWAPLPSDILPEGIPRVRAIISPAEKSDADLLVGGTFVNTVLRASGVAFWDDGEWKVNPFLDGLSGPVLELHSSDFLGGLAAFGGFDRAGSIAAPGAAVYSNRQWEPLGSQYEGVFGPIVESSSIDDAFLFAHRPDDPALALPEYEYAEWTGQEWVSMGLRPTFDVGPFSFAPVQVGAVYNDGTGDALFLGGSSIGLAGDIENLYPIARWDGNEITFPDILPTPPKPWYPYQNVVSMLVADLGEGPVLIIGCSAPLGLWQWDGTTSKQITGGLSSTIWEKSWISSVVKVGDEIIVSIDYTSPDFVQSESIILRLRDGIFEVVAYPLVQDLPFEIFQIKQLVSVQEPGGPVLYAIQYADLTYSNHRLLRYNGTTWSVVASEVNGPVYAVTAHDDGTGPALYIGGDFTEVDGVPSGFMAKRPFCDDQPCPPDVTGDGVIDLDDLNTVLVSFGMQTDSGDTNGDGIVDLDDLNTVLGSFGAVCK